MGPLRTSLPSTARKGEALTPVSPPASEFIQVVIAGSAEEDASRLFSPAARTHSEASTAETIHRVRAWVELGPRGMLQLQTRAWVCKSAGCSCCQVSTCSADVGHAYQGQHPV